MYHNAEVPGLFVFLTQFVIAFKVRQGAKKEKK